MLSITCIATALVTPSVGHSQDLRLPNNQRWLEVQQLSGTVNYRQGEVWRPALVGDRLQQVGQGIATALQSTSVLDFDTDIGNIRVAENTSLRVRTLTVMADGGRVTALAIDRGQARLQVRRFTHPSSNLEVETPAGVAAVRGTIFGVSVNDVGKTGVATLVGQVDASAQGETVTVNPGFATVIVPGEPPTEPRPLDQVLQLQTRTIQRTSGGIIFSGQVDPANLITVNGQPVETDANGRFRLFVPASPLNRSIRVIVRNPVGDERGHTVVAR